MNRTARLTGRPMRHWLAIVTIVAVFLPGVASAVNTAAQKLFADGYELLKADKPGEAAAKFESGLKLDPNSALAYFYLGEAYNAQHEPDKARKAYYQSLALDPTSSVAAQAQQRVAGAGQTASLPAAPAASPPVSAPAAAATATVAKTPGSVFRDCPDCPEMVVIPAGKFVMGSPPTEEGRRNTEGPPRIVTIAEAFALGKTEVTQGQWHAIIGNNPSNFNKCGDDCPVEQVSWDGAREYAMRLSAKTGKKYRLPSEAEWQYSCQAGSLQRYCGSDNPDSVAWYAGNSGAHTKPVAGKEQNAWGLYDMSGNVWEWVEDCWHADYSGAPQDGSPWVSGGECSRRVLRGGAWNYLLTDARAAYRSSEASGLRTSSGGFRVARALP